jgi:hypothetical protein
MTTENSVGADSDAKMNRPTIDWRQVHRNLRRLQMRIVKATQNCGEAASQEGRWKGLSGIWRKSDLPFLGEGGDSNAALRAKTKENICAPALAFVFAWHRIGAIASYEKQR